MTDSLTGLRDVEPCSMTVTGIEGKVCFAEAMGTLTMVFVNGDQEFIANLHDVIYVPKLGYKLCSPNVEFDGETWNHIGSPDGMMTGFGDRVTLHSGRRTLVTMG